MGSGSHKWNCYRWKSSIERPLAAYGNASCLQVSLLPPFNGPCFRGVTILAPRTRCLPATAKALSAADLPFSAFFNSCAIRNSGGIRRA